MSAAPIRVDRSFAATWQADVLTQPPLIAPARQFVLPRPVPGEEDALARGALYVLVRPGSGGSFLATCALGFLSPNLPTGVWSCPNADSLLAVAGGYAYLVPTKGPEGAQHLDPRPVTQLLAVPAQQLLLLAGFHAITAISVAGVAWKSARLTWEGLTLGLIEDGQLHGTGWNMKTDRDVPFALDLATGKHTGGGFEP